jgi:PAS domain S-box-containing protein
MSDETDFASVTRSEALLAEAEQLANLGSWEHDLESGLISRSANLCRMLGAEPTAKVIPEDFFWDLVAPEDHEIVRNTIDRATANRDSYEYQARFIMPDGSNRTFLTRGKPIIDSTNRVVKRIGVALDITERAESAVALEKSEERYRDLVENSRDLICTHDLDGRLLSMNELPAKLLGYRPEELIGRRLCDMLCPKSRGEFDDYMGRIQRDGSAQGLMALLTSSVEHRIWEYDNTLRIKGVLTPIVRGIAHDVTEHMEAERSLRRSESLLTQAEELANMGSWELDVEAQTLTWSSQFFRLLGLEPELGPIPADRAKQMIHLNDRERASHDVEQVLTRRIPLDNVLRFIRDDGKVRFFHSRCIGITDGTGRVVRVRGMSQDITDRLQAEEDLHRLSRELMRARDCERRKIARDLHESVGQSLAALKMSLGRVR